MSLVSAPFEQYFFRQHSLLLLSNGSYSTEHGYEGARNAKRANDDEEVAIAVMGVTDSGKPTFINLVSGSSLTAVSSHVQAQLRPRGHSNCRSNRDIARYPWI
ncbi:uncharacterized protein LAESUDRAFT_383649 [Laetiporus sulphureus 93-53]|uniref:G domain-containing protein n=1 Tax=Laetiporus sulphureus 93-53 TaxID=1314785 RepID=A0A165CME5_9APHY|nr:uncharacterized protein LAESUDRAFT_383649 [Laetiporus sulphureus 93-53]KZT03072.1 hypothetical protein LAESUDRAFT_383649 [Laetiporus sulphureus 93-53]